MEKLRMVVDRYNAVEKWVLIIMFAVLVVVIFTQVVMRYVFGYAISWSEELGRFIFIWISWLGVSTGIKEGEHIQVKVLPNFLHDKGFLRSELVLYIFIDLIWMLTSLVVCYYGLDVVAQQKSIGVIAVATHVPMWIIYSCIPISALLVCLRLIGQMAVNTGALLFGTDRENLEAIK